MGFILGRWLLIVSAGDDKDEQVPGVILNEDPVHVD